jgi:hypothetical protein
MRVAEPLLPRSRMDSASSSVQRRSVLITGFTLAYGLFQLVPGPWATVSASCGR